MDRTQAIANGLSELSANEGEQVTTVATIEEPPVISGTLRQAQRSVLRRLESVRRALRLHLLVEGLSWVVAAVLIATVTTLILDRLLRFNLPTRMGLLAIALAAISYVVVQRLIRPLLLPLDDLDLAELIDRRVPGVGQRISNVLQLPDLLRSGIHASPSMIHATVVECAEALDRVDLAAALNTQRRRKLLMACGAAMLLAIGWCVVWPATAELWARRWLAGSTVRWPQKTYLSLDGLGGETKLLVPRGELLLLHINAKPEFSGASGAWLLAGRGEPLVVESVDPPESQPPDQVSISYLLASGDRRRGNAEQFGETSFRYELPPLAEPVEISIYGGDDWLGPITIEPIDRPAVSTLEITARWPGSAEDRTEKVGEGNSQLLFLPKTQLELRLVANQPLESAEALDKLAPVSGWEKVDDRTYVLRWTMQDSMALEFRLKGQRGGLTSKPYFLAIGLLKDREPRVTIRSSGVGRRVTPVARIPLTLRANDDFGLASLALDVERTSLVEDKPQAEVKREDLDIRKSGEGPARTEVELEHELQLASRGLAPGNSLKLRGAAQDASTLGAQAGNSRWLAFQVVSSEELFYEILMRQREQRAKFARALESAKAQSKALGELTNADDIQGLARAQQVIGRQVWQVTGALDATLQEMTLNDLASGQARDNLQSGIITPLRTLHNDLLARLRTAIDGLAPDRTISPDRRVAALALADQSVEAMQTILGQMALWESFIDVVNQLQQIINRQGDLLKSTEEIDKERTDKLFDE